MMTRIISSVVLFPLLATFIVIGGNALKIGVFFLSAVAMTEVYKAFSKKILPINYISYIFIAIYYLFIDAILQNFTIVFLFLFIISNLTYMVIKHTKVTPIDCAINIFVFFYVGLLLSAIYLTRELDYGNFLVWFIFISAWGCDTAAYFTGKAIGKTKLIETLSPNKTIEGFIGGILGAMLIGGIYACAVTYIYNLQEVGSIIVFIIASGIGGIFSQVGDLTASAIKRYTNLKDYGKIIPGHGGIMDRFDSIIFTAPVVYSVIIILANLR